MVDGSLDITLCSWLTLSEFGRLLIIARLVRLGRVLFNFIRSASLLQMPRSASNRRQHQNVKQAARQLVSQNRRRYVKDGFDVDITYVTGEVIAFLLVDL